MVDLPKIPRRLITAEEPRSGLTARDIAAPYASFANAMSEGADALETAAEANVEDAAAKAITVGEDGQVNVERTAIPMVGKVGRHYDRLVRTGAVVREDSIADTNIDQMRRDHRDNPVAFRAAAEAYRDERVARMDEKIGPAGGAALRRQMDSRINQNYTSLENEHQNRTIKREAEALDARVVTLGNDLETLARRNGIVGSDGQPTPEYQERWQNLKTLLDEKVNNPLLAYPREKADAYLDTLNTRVQGAAIHEQVERIYRGDGEFEGRRGFEAARDYLKTASRSIEGRVKEVDKIERAGLAWLRSEEAGFRAERAEISRSWSAMRPNAANEPRQTLIDMEEQAIAVGNFRTAMDIRTTRGALDVVSEVRALPVQEQAAMVRGGSVNLVDRIVGAESNNDPNARPRIDPATGRRPSSAEGLGQFTKDTWRHMIRTYRPELAQGKTDEEILALRRDGDLSKEMVGRYAQENGQRLAAANVPVNDGSLYLAHFLGPGDAIKVLSAPPGTPLAGLVNPASIAANQSIFSRNPTAGQLQQWAAGKVGGAAPDPATSRVGSMALTMLKRELTKDLGPRLDALGDRMRRGEMPAPDEMTEVASLVSAVGTPQQRRKAAELAVAAQVGAEFQQMPAPQRDAQISAMETRLREGGTQVESDLTQVLRTQDAAISKAYNDDPYGAFYRYGKGDAAQPLPPIDFANPGEAGQIIGAKIKQQGVFRQQEGLGPVSILRPTEAEAFRGTMAQGDARIVAASMGALNTLPDDVLAATLKDPRVKGGITSAIHSTDPTKVAAVMSNLEVWHRRDPNAFKAQFGEDTENALLTWRDTTRYMTPEQFAERQRKVQDPAAAKVYEHNLKEGRQQAMAIKPDDVISDMTPFLSSGPLSVFGTGPALPSQGAVRDQFIGDFVNLYSRRYAENPGDKGLARTQAVEQLGQKWTRSSINGGEVMLRAPESVYPMVNGTHDWMAPQIEADVAEQLGVPRRASVPSMAPGAQGKTVVLGMGPTNWDYRIVPDATTEQEAQRYDRRLPISETNRPPSYQVVIRDNRRQTPRWEPAARRLHFDPSSAQEASRARFVPVPAPDGGGGGF